MGKKKCTCKHLGQCPVNDYMPSALWRTYPDGTKVFRALSSNEERNSRMQINVNGEVQKLRDPAHGDSVATDGEGNVVITAKAIEPERCVAYARKAIGLKCKAGSFFWRKRNPVPEVDKLFTGIQIPEDRKSPEDRKEPT